MEGYGIGILLVALALYFLPSIVAMVREKENGTGGVLLVNLFLGWTVVGWLLAFVWGCSGRTKKEARLEDKRHREMLAMLAATKKE